MTDAELSARLRANLLAIKALQARTSPLRVLDLPGVRALCLTAPGTPSFQQQVLYEHPGALAPALPEVEAWYRAHGVSAWRVPVSPEDSGMEAALTAAGYRPEGGVPAMGLCLAPAPPSRLPPSLRVERTGDMSEVVALNAHCYGPGAMDFLHDWHVTPPPALHGVLVREARDVLAVGMAFDLEDTAGIYLVATHPGARRRGLGARVMEALHQDALERGRAAAVLQSTEEAWNLYHRLGYRSVGTWINWVRRTGPRLPGDAPE